MAADRDFDQLSEYVQKRASDAYGTKLGQIAVAIYDTGRRDAVKELIDRSRLANLGRGQFIIMFGVDPYTGEIHDGPVIREGPAIKGAIET